MERIDRINAMLEKGKITPDQARLLKNALENSHKDVEPKDETQGSKERIQSNGLMIVSVGLVLLMLTGFGLLFILVYGNSAQDGTDINLSTRTALTADAVGRPATQQNPETRAALRKTRTRVTAVLFSGVLAIIAVSILCLAGVLTFNRIIRLREELMAQWFGVRIQIRKKLHLIPAMEDLLKESLSHEDRIIQAISNARGTLGSLLGRDESGVANIQQIVTESEGLNRSILAVSENYPELKSNTAVMFLLNSLFDIEQTIARQWVRYNHAVKRFNQITTRFPGVLITLAVKPGQFEYADGSELLHATTDTETIDEQ
ncbi:MAG: LemA family protein [Desulfobacteraceae bacterium]|nr:MAG: LemA family protein [Desulfobacteraceae bacterium]